jgi:hypothetical protein
LGDLFHSFILGGVIDLGRYFAHYRQPLCNLSLAIFILGVSCLAFRLEHMRVAFQVFRAHVERTLALIRVLHHSGRYCYVFMPCGFLSQCNCIHLVQGICGGWTYYACVWARMFPCLRHECRFCIARRVVMPFL